MNLTTTLQGQAYSFKSVKDVLAKSAEKRSGDELIGVAAQSERERIAAKWVVSESDPSGYLRKPRSPL